MPERIQTAMIVSYKIYFWVIVDTVSDTRNKPTPVNLMVSIVLEVHSLEIMEEI